MQTKNLKVTKSIAKDQQIEYPLGRILNHELYKVENPNVRTHKRQKIKNYLQCHYNSSQHTPLYNCTNNQNTQHIFQYKFHHLSKYFYPYMDQLHYNHFHKFHDHICICKKINKKIKKLNVNKKQKKNHILKRSQSIQT